MHMYIISGQNSHHFNVSSMPKSTPCELSVAEHFLSAHNWIGTCRPRQSRLTTIPSLAGSFMRNKSICYLVWGEQGTNLDPGGIPS